MLVKRKARVLIQYQTEQYDKSILAGKYEGDAQLENPFLKNVHAIKNTLRVNQQ